MNFLRGTWNKGRAFQTGTTRKDRKNADNPDQDYTSQVDFEEDDESQQGPQSDDSEDKEELSSENEDLYIARDRRYLKKELKMESEDIYVWSEEGEEAEEVDEDEEEEGRECESSEEEEEYDDCEIDEEDEENEDYDNSSLGDEDSMDQKLIKRQLSQIVMQEEKRICKHARNQVAINLGKRFNAYEDWRILYSLRRYFKAGGANLTASTYFWENLEDPLTKRMPLSGLRTSDAVYRRYRNYLLWMNSADRKVLYDYAETHTVEDMKVRFCIFRMEGEKKKFIGITKEPCHSLSEVTRITMKYVRQYNKKMKMKDRLRNLLVEPEVKNKPKRLRSENNKDRGHREDDILYQCVKKRRIGEQVRNQKRESYFERGRRKMNEIVQKKPQKEKEKPKKSDSSGFASAENNSQESDIDENLVGSIERNEVQDVNFIILITIENDQRFHCLE